jgi:hypothetical protein
MERLHDFLTSNREHLISCCREKVAERVAPALTAEVIDHGVPAILEQLVETLKQEQTTPVRAGAPEPAPAPTSIGRAAAINGAELLRRGFSVDQVVHGYGDVCQCVTALAVERQVSISADEFRTLNRCLDNAIADAVASFGAARQTSNERQLQDWQERLNVFAAEHRRLSDIAIQSLAAIQTGNIGTSGATGRLLAHALGEIRSLADRTLPEILSASAEIS